MLNDAGATLENFVATTLLKRLHFIEDYYGYRCALHYIRDKEGREVDFAVMIDDVLEYLIEVKLTDATLSNNLCYYNTKLQPKHAVQLVSSLPTDKSYENFGIIVTNPINFFTNIALPPWEV